MKFQKGESGYPAAKWKKGQSGNPAGYSKSRRLMSSVLNDLLALKARRYVKREHLPDELAGAREGGKPGSAHAGKVNITLTLAEHVGLALIKHTLAGKGSYARLLMEYNSGKPPQTIRHEGEIKVPLEDARDIFDKALEAAADAVAKSRGKKGASRPT